MTTLLASRAVLTRVAVAVLALTVSSAPGVARQAKPPAAAELDKLLAPIALYPDQLLAQMLLAAGSPAKVGALSDWLAAQTSLKGTELQDAAVKAGFDANFVALVLFPDVVQVMASRMDWTRALGEAFAANRDAVFQSVQRLRGQAKTAGTLKTTPQQEVSTKTTSAGQQVIVIEPANPQIVYVPQYNPQTVYAPTTSTVVVQESSSSGDAVAAGIIGFTAGIAIGAAIDNDYYYGPYGWGRPVHMYNDAWDDWYDDREDAREDWMDHREDLAEDRGERARETQEERTERRDSTQQQRTERRDTAQQQRTERSANRTGAEGASAGTAAATGATGRSASQESRGYSSTTRSAGERKGTSSDAFSGYSSGKSERAASSRGERSRSKSRSGGGGGSRRR